MMPPHIEQRMAEALYEGGWNIEQAMAIFKAKTVDQEVVKEKQFVRLRAAIAKQRMRELIAGRNSAEVSFSELWHDLGALRKYVTEKDEERLWQETRIWNRWGVPDHFKGLQDRKPE